MDVDDDILVLNESRIGGLRAKGGDRSSVSLTDDTTSRQALVQAYHTLKSRYNDLDVKYLSLQKSKMYDQGSDKACRSTPYSTETEHDPAYAAGAVSGNVGAESRAELGIKSYLERELRMKSVECQNLQRMNGGLNEKYAQVIKENENMAMQLKDKEQQLAQCSSVKDESQQMLESRLQEEKHNLQEEKNRLQEEDRRLQEEKYRLQEEEHQRQDQYRRQVADSDNRMQLIADLQGQLEQAEKTIEFEQRKYHNIKEDCETVVAKSQSDVEYYKKEAELHKKQPIIPKCARCSEKLASSRPDTQAGSLPDKSGKLVSLTTGDISEIMKLKDLTNQLKKTVEEQQRTIQQYIEVTPVKKSDRGAHSLPAPLRPQPGRPPLNLSPIPETSRNNVSRTVMSQSQLMQSNIETGLIMGASYLNPISGATTRSSSTGPLDRRKPELSMIKTRKTSDSELITMPSCPMSPPRARADGGPYSEPYSRHKLNFSHQQMVAESTAVRSPRVISSDSTPVVLPPRDSLHRTGVNVPENRNYTQLSTYSQPSTLTGLQPSDSAPIFRGDNLQIAESFATNIRQPQENEDVTTETVHICPVCNVDFTYLAVDDFQTHVLECFDTETPTMQPERGPFERRNCPMCSQLFAPDVTQEVFVSHVNGHFNDDPSLDFHIVNT